MEEWYPTEPAARERLSWYAEHFDAVEVNSTFYAVPTASTVERWAEQTPDGFTFDVKLHKLLSRHSAKLDSLPPICARVPKRPRADASCSTQRYVERFTPAAAR